MYDTAECSRLKCNVDRYERASWYGKAPAGPIIPIEPQNDLHTKCTKMERKMNQNGTGSRVWCFILVYTYSMVKIIWGFTLIMGSAGALSSKNVDTKNFKLFMIEVDVNCCAVRTKQYHAMSESG